MTFPTVSRRGRRGLSALFSCVHFKKKKYGGSAPSAPSGHLPLETSYGMSSPNFSIRSKNTTSFTPIYPRHLLCGILLRRNYTRSFLGRGCFVWSVLFEDDEDNITHLPRYSTDSSEMVFPSGFERSVILGEGGIAGACA